MPGRHVPFKQNLPIFLHNPLLTPQPLHPAGNLHFRNVTVRDDRERPILRIRDRHGNGLKAITGDIIHECNGQRTPITIDDAWLDTMRSREMRQE